MSVTQNRRNYYRILHVQPDAPGAVLKSSYRALMMSLDMHPDRGGEHWNAALVNEAYGVLSDPAQRAEYDRTLEAARSRRQRPGDGAAVSGRPERADGHAAAEAERNDDAPSCLFCGAERSSEIGPSSAGGTCLECRSPLTRAGTPHLEASGRRAARRIAREGNIGYYATWPQARPGQGVIVDLSPRGLQFETKTPIARFQIIKLAGPLLDAVARVASCRERGDSFAVGVEFYTVRFNLPRGTFLSTSA